MFEARGLQKAYSGVPVLRGVSFTAAAGEVLGIVGENGAGKSTLMNVVGGVTAADAGEMRLGGEAYRPASPGEAAARGVAFVHQELNLFPNLSVTDNLFLTGDRGDASAALRTVGLDVDPSTLVERLSLAERQLVEIARAVGTGRAVRVVVLDEPTTSLSRREAERLFGIVRGLSGVAVIFISHALEDVLGICQRVMVLRDGAAVAEGAVSEFTNERLISAMVGRSIEQVYPPKPERELGAVVLEARGVSQPGVAHEVGFALRRGEVLGIAGLMGSGRSELARILFGLDPHSSGEISLEGERIDRLSTRERIGRGLAFVTESRRDDGLFLDQAVAPNLTIVARGAVAGLIERLRIRSADADRQPVQQLSGGNQQKVALGKWLVRPPKALILDEPTRGIDVGAKHEIYRTILELAAGGAGVLVISSEIEELMGICDRVLVMRKGELREAAGFDREEILKAAL